MTKTSITKLAALISKVSQTQHRVRHLHCNVNKVETPFQLLNSERVDPLVKDTAQRREAEAQRETLGADIVGENLDGVRDGQTRPSSASDT